METVRFGRSKARISRMGIGTYYDFKWIIPAKALGIRSGFDRKADAIKTAIECGINLIDTAEIYESEPIVAKAIEGIDREKLFIATKVFPTHYSYKGVIKACENSLKRLNTEYIDLYQLHASWRPGKVKEALRAMEYLADEGKIRHIGISNFDIGQTKEAAASLRKYELASTQMNFNVAHRSIEKDIIGYCKENGIAVLAYYPLAHGILAKGTQEAESLMRTVEKNHGKKSMPQIALNWFISKYDFVFPIPRASNPEHVKDNAGSVGWKMNNDEIAMLEDLAKKLDVKSTSWDKT